MDATNVQEFQRLKNRRQHLVDFFLCERSLREYLRKIFVGVLHRKKKEFSAVERCTT